MPAGKTSPEADVARERASAQRRRVFEWYIRLAIGMVLLTVAFSSKFTTPIHVTFSGGWSFLPLADWALVCLAAAVLTGIVSAFLERLHRASSDVGKLAAGSLLFVGVCLFCSQAIVEGANVHFDSSPVARVTTQILRIEPAPSGSKRGATLHLAGWGGSEPGKTVRARQDVRVFRMDLDAKYATFYVRKGFFGVPYATEFK
ncbi:hypothetical protein SAMN05216350_102132 [Polaromonas sp. YR568]|uniref:hypothetical protein n=1 Tax=Polaromonas sp. YR568 TaxID=1855301 RepID=UPI0008E2E6AB|nr:hypothetical protein [Polaromonas sp. YR568]SFU48631.1 hypothetical protein SAMN05216350_102132 [Polaromonas sp. YR568]